MLLTPLLSTLLRMTVTKQILNYMYRASSWLTEACAESRCRKTTAFTSRSAPLAMDPRSPLRNRSPVVVQATPEPSVVEALSKQVRRADRTVRTSGHVPLPQELKPVDPRSPANFRTPVNKENDAKAPATAAAVQVTPEPKPAGKLDMST